MTVKLTPKEQWLFNFVSSGPEGFRSFEEIFFQNDLDNKGTLTKNYLKVLTFNIREKGRVIETVQRKGLRASSS